VSVSFRRQAENSSKEEELSKAKGEETRTVKLKVPETSR